ncbi:tetratricopeptide repeat protein [Candidatus Roizmanbacteria bacterium]|nr:tetratricopeptide repeat protein [Candidatus Roizmanbacteria bacterium]
MDIKPNFEKAAYLNNLGVIEAKNNNLTKAISSFRKALTFYPNYEKSLYNLGSLEIRVGKYNRAIKHFRQLIHLNNQDPVSYYKLAYSFFRKGNVHQAEMNYQKALQINPDYEPALVDLGSLYMLTEFYPQAIKQLEKALQINPNNTYAIGFVLYISQIIVDFSRVDKWTAVLNRLTAQALKTGEGTLETPFPSIARKSDPEENFKVAKYWSKTIKDSLADLKTNFSFEDRKKVKRKINIGYLSYDFRNHPTSHLIFSLFRLHNRERFNIFTYSSGPDDKSVWRKYIEKNSDVFRDIKKKSDFEMAKLIYKDKVDILVDLMGYIKNSKIAILALGPSPVQVSWLGFPGTTGADFMDYIIADKIVLPEKDIPFYSEKPLYLPCYQMYSTTGKTPKNKIKKSDFGLPEKSIVFTSFNQTYKIEKDLFSIWMEILKAIPGSILWQLETNSLAKENLKKEAKKKGINPSRIIFAARIPREEHLERLTLADLGLDTFTYNGHTTTSDCLWAGVPVITLKGNHFASRVSASLLSTVGLPELITQSKDDYKSLAIKLASQPKELKKLKNKLAKNRLTSSLFNAEKFIKNLEKLYEKIWNDYLKI